uniref:Uncharacterized protein n=1 Tax=Anguilla anguilla TaxID=7936 RepID=A0A0E9RNB4_ANGAN
MNCCFLYPLHASPSDTFIFNTSFVIKRCLLLSSKWGI